MIEHLERVTPEEYHEHVYPQVITGDIVLQLGFETTIVTPNPEKYPYALKTFGSGKQASTFVK